YIYYVSSEKTERGSTEPRAQLYRMALIGGPAVRLKEDLDSAIAFSPDGKSYVFVREVAGANESRLITASLEGGVEKTIASRTLPDIFDFPTWAPDGKSVAAVAASYRAEDRLVIYAADGSGQKQTPLSLRAWGHIYKIEWANLGKSILVAGKDWNGGDFQLWQVAYPSGEVTRLTKDLNAYFRVSATKDFRELVTVQESAAQSIWVAIDGDAGKTKELSSLAEHYYGIGWMPDGQIVYDSDASGQSSIWVMDEDGNSRKQITRGENFDRYPVASPDGKFIFYVSCTRLERECDVWKVDLDGANPKRITEGSRASGLAITPDGQWLVYAAPTLARYSTLWKLPVSGGAAQQINPNLATLPAVSPDGKRIACFYTKGEGDSQVEKPVLAILPFAGGPPEKIFEIPPTVNVLAGLQWVDGGAAIAYVDDGPRNSNLWKQPVNGDPARMLTNFHGDRFSLFAWSENGDKVVYRRDVVNRDVVLMEGME
ncbi:MAG TPA: hypothetical protein VMH89_04485, partial [Candidatus Acidoferrum sp.]|nr:hypothetical protein [Candidatus Acidoferrum sp.]